MIDYNSIEFGQQFATDISSTSFAVDEAANEVVASALNARNMKRFLNIILFSKSTTTT